MPIEKRWDARRTLLIFDEASQLIRTSALHFASIVRDAIQKRGVSYLALSGGSTPKAIFQVLTTLGVLTEQEWSKLHLFWSDERSVPPSHPDSNYKMAMEAGFGHMPIPSHHIHRMKAEDHIEKHALEYEQLINQILGQSPFDLIMLGMGEDGHTASLFPHTAALHSTHQIAANYIPEKKTWRMTMTFSCLHRTRNLVVYALGALKKEMFNTLFCSPDKIDQFPAQGVGTPSCPALWMVDRAIAEPLL